jgi:hypothetical protein
MKKETIKLTVYVRIEYDTTNPDARLDAIRLAKFNVLSIKTFGFGYKTNPYKATLQR